jgi:hypothetical protein
MGDWYARAWSMRTSVSTSSLPGRNTRMSPGHGSDACSRHTASKQACTHATTNACIHTSHTGCLQQRKSSKDNGIVHQLRRNLRTKMSPHSSVHSHTRAFACTCTCLHVAADWRGGVEDVNGELPALHAHHTHAPVRHPGPALAFLRSPARAAATVCVVAPRQGRGSCSGNGRSGMCLCFDNPGGNRG